MRKIFKYQSLSKIIYFLFYILISTSGILSAFYLLLTVFAIFQQNFYPNPYLIRDLISQSMLGLPSIGLVIVSWLIVRRVEQTKMFFVLTFFVILVSHFLLSRATHIELGDMRLVMAAILYLSFLSLTLTIARQRIIAQRNYKDSFFLLVVMIILIIVNYTPEFLTNTYVSFAWSLNSIDYLFSKLNLDFTYFVIIVTNIFCCIAVLTLLNIKSFFQKNKK